MPFIKLVHVQVSENLTVIHRNDGDRRHIWWTARQSEISWTPAIFISYRSGIMPKTCFLSMTDALCKMFHTNRTIWNTKTVPHSAQYARIILFCNRTVQVTQSHFNRVGLFQDKVCSKITDLILLKLPYGITASPSWYRSDSTFKLQW